MPLAALIMNLLGEWGTPTPLVEAPTIVGGMQRYPQNLLITADGQILLDLKTVMVGLDGQIFLNLNGIYTSPDGRILLNLNANKPIFMVIE